jgi:hypothetical protein
VVGENSPNRGPIFRTFFPGKIPRKISRKNVRKFAQPGHKVIPLQSAEAVEEKRVTEISSNVRLTKFANLILAIIFVRIV